jgi:predicted small secreted protein
MKWRDFVIPLGVALAITIAIRKFVPGAFG